MKCPKCGYENTEGVEHCDLCKEVLAKPVTPKPVILKDFQGTKKPREEFRNPLSLRHLLYMLIGAYLLFRIIMALLWGSKAIMGQVGVNAIVDKVEKGTYNVKDYLSAQDKVKYDQAIAAIDLLGKVIKNKVKEDGVFPATIADLRNTKDFDEKKLIDPFGQNGQFIKYQVVPAGRGMVFIYSVGPDGRDDGGRYLSMGGKSGDVRVTFDKLYPLEPRKTDVEKYGKEYETLPNYTPSNEYKGYTATDYFDEPEEDVKSKEARILYAFIVRSKNWPYKIYVISNPWKDEQGYHHTYEIRYNIEKKVLWKIAESYDNVEKRWKYDHGIIENVNMDMLKSFCFTGFPYFRPKEIPNYSTQTVWFEDN